MLTVQNRLVEVLSPRAEGKIVSDVRIGLGYTAVRLDSGHAGVAWTPKTGSSSCTHLRAAGTLAGTPAGEILSMLAQKSPAARAVGLATANALLAASPQADVSREEVVGSLCITEKDHVAMVGYFAPLIGGLKKSGCRLDIVELNPDHGEGTLPPEEGKAVLAACTVAVVTGTSLINGTFDEVNDALGNPRAAVLLGPSSPLFMEAFRGTKITHVAGSRVIDSEAVLRVVSEGGGTMLMKPYLDFQTVTVADSTGENGKSKKGPCTGEHCNIEKCHQCRIEPSCPASKVR